MNRFADLTPAPPDPILGLTDAFKADPRSDKVNLAVGVFQDAMGRTPALRAVEKAEQMLASQDRARGYLPITGFPTYLEQTQRLIFGDAVAELPTPVVSLQAPGGTGALRVAADFLHARLGVSRAWISTPTWVNHAGIFQAAGIDTAAYAYFDATANAVDFPALVQDLREKPSPGDVVILHGCCHNPTGADLTTAQWATIATLCAERGLLPLLDFAYQGFGDGIVEDAAGVRAFLSTGAPFFVASSYSKNFGLYQDRVGLLSFVAPDGDVAQTVASQLKTIVRTNYSNPPAHGGLVVATILESSELRAEWEHELSAMRARILEMRHGLVDGLKAAGAPRDYRFLVAQRGMFSFTGLSKEQVSRLQAEHAIYIVGSGRINVAGLTPQNIERVCRAIAAVS